MAKNITALLNNHKSKVATRVNDAKYQRQIKVIHQLQAKVNTKTYRKGLFRVRLATTNANLIACLKKLVLYLLSFVPAYLEYSYLQLLITNVIIAGNISSKTLWYEQQQIYIGVGILIVLLGTGVLLTYKIGRIKRPYKSVDLTPEHLPATLKKLGYAPKLIAKLAK